MQPTSKHTIELLVISGLLMVLVGSILILAAVPPVSRDALTHHLAVPKLYLNHGGMYEIPGMLFSYYPMNLDLLYMIPLYFGNDILQKYIHCAFALLTAWLIFGYLKKRTSALYALTGVLLFLSIPVIVRLSIIVYVDLGLVFFSTAALLNFLKWIEASFKLKYLVISAVWCGLAMGTKYNGFIVLFLLTLFIPFVYSRIRQAAAAAGSSGAFFSFTKDASLAVGYAAAFMVIALIIFSPWAVRNYIWTGNPVYPLYDKFFQLDAGEHLQLDQSFDHNGFDENDSERRSQGFANPFVMRKMIYRESIWQIVAVPIRIFFQGQDNRPQYFDGKLNPYLLLLPFFAFLFKTDENAAVKREKNILLAFAVLFLLLAFFQRDMRIRYVAPIIPALVILSIYGLKNMLTTVKAKCSGYSLMIGTGIIVVAVSLLVSMNAAYVRQLFRQVQPFGYLTSRVGRDAYIEKYRPEYAAIQYVNHNLAGDAKIFCLFMGNRSYYSDRQMIFGDMDFEEFVKKADSAESLVDEFKKREITHLLVGYKIFNPWFQRQFNEHEKKNILMLFKAHARLLFKKGGYGLYGL